MNIDRIVIDLVSVFGVFWILFYFVALRPQRRGRRVQRELLAAIKSGDEIVTTEGLFGTVRQVGDTVIVLEIANHKKVRLLKSDVSQVLSAREGSKLRG